MLFSWSHILLDVPSYFLYLAHYINAKEHWHINGITTATSCCLDVFLVHLWKGKLFLNVLHVRVSQIRMWLNPAVARCSVTLGLLHRSFRQDSSRWWSSWHKQPSNPAQTDFSWETVGGHSITFVVWHFSLHNWTSPCPVYMCINSCACTFVHIHTYSLDHINLKTILSRKETQRLTRSCFSVVSLLSLLFGSCLESWKVARPL